MLTINYNNTDLTLKLEEFNLPTVAITLLANEVIYIGYTKPINNFHAELNNSVDSPSKINLQYDNGSGLQDVLSLLDRTNGLGNSGRISWDIPSDSIPSVNFGKNLYWYELSVDINTEERSFVGINVLFTDDNDLVEEYPGILDELPEEANSFVNFHASAKKDIVQYLRKRHSVNNGLLGAYDLLNNYEVKQASKYLALSKVMSWLSENPDDKWAVKGPVHFDKYTDFIESVEVTIDLDGNGVVDKDEVSTVVNSVKLVRL